MSPSSLSSPSSLIVDQANRDSWARDSSSGLLCGRVSVQVLGTRYGGVYHARGRVGTAVHASDAFLPPGHMHPPLHCPPCTCTCTCTCLHLRFCQFHGIALKPPGYLSLPFSPCLHLLAVLIPHGPHPMSSRLLVTIAFRFSPRARKDCRRWCRIEYPPVQAVRAVPRSVTPSHDKVSKALPGPSTTPLSCPYRQLHGTLQLLLVLLHSARAVPCPCRQQFPGHATRASIDRTLRNRPPHTHTHPPFVWSSFPTHHPAAHAYIDR